MKYRKKSIEVDLRKYAKGEFCLGVTIRPDGTAYVWSDLHKSEINIEDGDYVNVTTKGDFYPITKDKVAELYEEV